MKAIYVVIGFFVIGALVILFIIWNGRDTTFEKDKIINGFVFNSLASATEQNGYIFAIDKKTGEQQYLLSIKVPEVSSPVNLPSDSNCTTTTFGSVLNWLSGGKAQKTGGSFQMDTKLKVKLNFKDAVLCQTPLLAAQSTIDSAIVAIRTKLNIMDVDSYDFKMISQTIKAKGLDYEFDKKVSADEHFKADVKKAASFDPKIGVKNQRNMQLCYQDTAYRVVLYKTFKLGINHSIAGAYVVKVLPDSN